MVKYDLYFIVLGMILVALGVLLFTTLKFLAIISLIIGLIALVRGFTLRTSSKKKNKEIVEEERKETEEKEEVAEDENASEADEESEKGEDDEENSKPEESSDDEESDHEILGLKVKPGLHTKILKKIEPSVDALKPMLFWPFVSKSKSKEDEQKKSKDFKYCKECGTKMPRAAKFCPECGK